MQSIIQLVKKKKILFICIAIAIIAIIFLLFYLPIGAKDATSTYVTATVSKNTITNSISGSGSLVSASYYDVTSSVNAEIKSVYVAEGDKVKKGQVLAVLDGSSVKLARDKAKLDYENALEEKENIQTQLNNLNLNSTISGIITQLNVAVYKNVQKGDVIAQVTDDSVMSAKIYFSSLTDLNKFSTGQSVTGITASGKTFSATIASKNASLENVGGGSYYSLTLNISNTNSAFKDGASEVFTINDGTDEYTSAQSSTVNYIYSAVNIISKVSGEICNVYYSTGNKITNGGTIAKIDGGDLEKSLENQNIAVEEALLNYNNAKEAVNNLNITAQQSGTVSSLNAKSGQIANGTLMTISDFDNLNVVMSVDELDINSIKVGQKTDVTSSLYEDTTFSGTISKIALEGSAQNGVTTFDVTISMDEIKDLKPGMSVDIEIILEESENALSLPLSAVQKDDKGYFVYKTDNTTDVTDEALEKSKTYIEVGLTNTAYAEIKSGLLQGDTVIYLSVTSSSGNKNSQRYFMQNGGGNIPSGTNSQQRPSMPSGGGQNGN
ncbi:MAG: efflux RND transporter periplasmic adaptor subunit [Eubacteriaceae bacterium]|nr:efflux RND transporter periplasmic adaptor subunit [Eubacteriaceae bacterium]